MCFLLTAYFFATQSELTSFDRNAPLELDSLAPSEIVLNLFRLTGLLVLDFPAWRGA